MPKDFDEKILGEGGFTLELSNRGAKLMKNPNPVNYKSEEVPCRAEGCNKRTKSIYGLCPRHTGDGPKHEKDWIGRIIPPGHTRGQCLTDAPAHSKITEMLAQWMGRNKVKMKIMDDFISDALDGPELGIVGNIPDATTLQQNLEKGLRGGESPSGVVERMRRLVDAHFPKAKFDAVLLDGGVYRSKSLKDIPIRIVAAMLIIAFACEESNRGDAWFYKKHKEDLNHGKSRYASAYMSSVYYLLRRHTKASETQARMSLKG